MSHTRGIFTQEVSAPTVVSPQRRTELADGSRTLEAHAAALLSTPAMTEIRRGGKATEATLSFPLTIGAWNLERCLMPEQSAAVLAREGAALVLLSEMDSGMARTGQRDTTAVMAGELGMEFAYGVEFLELTLGAAHEVTRSQDRDNALGFHGNAVAARVPLHSPCLIRLDDDARWYLDPALSEQARIGGRVAIAARVETESGPILAVSTHLESNSLQDFRALQMERLLDAIDSLAPDLPVILGGDMNTGNKMPEADWRAEGLFELVRERGYEVHGGAPEGFTTRKSLLSMAPTRQMKLDWFFTRGLDVTQSSIVPALDDEGTPLSDHELMICELRGIRSL